MNKLGLFVLIFVFSSLQIFGQTYGDFSFSGLPQDYQLYPRNTSTNKSNVSVKAKTLSSNSLGLFVSKNGKNIQIIKPSAVAGSYYFNFTITAELAEYDFAFYSYKGSDSSLVVKKSNIVCGDVILVSGQSNAKLGPMDSNVYQGEWLRTFGKNNLIQDLTKSYELSDTLWNTQKLNLSLDPIASDYLGLGLGPFASEVAKLIIESEKIPVAIISNAQPSTTIDFHLHINGDLISPKGSDILYYKVNKAGLINDIRTLIFIQGEAEIISNNAATWIDKFNQFKSKLKTFFPNLQKVAIPQLNIYSIHAKNSAFLRNEQRKLSDQADVITWATVGNSGFEGLHYFGEKYKTDPTNLYLFENAGYLQLAKEAVRLILKESYNRNLNIQVQSPNLQRAYFPDEDTRNKIILEFEEGQNMKVTSDTLVSDYTGKKWSYELKNNFFYTRYNQNSMGPYIKNITSEGNKVMIDLLNNYDSNIISYLPEFHQDDSDKSTTLHPFPGPFLKNEMGMRAFAFSDIEIGVKVDNSNEFKLYPNPSYDWIEIKFNSNKSGILNLLDESGIVRFTRRVENQRIANVNLFYIPIITGKYYLQFINDSGGVSSKSVIKLSH